MKTTAFYKGHKWTTQELTKLMHMWQADEPVEEIAGELNSTWYAVQKMVVRLRQQGIPLTRRKKGHIGGRKNSPWTQAEVEYLIRRRQEKSTSEQIAVELGRTHGAVSGMIQNLRKQEVPVAMFGMGVRKLWSPEILRAVATEFSPHRHP